MRGTACVLFLGVCAAAVFCAAQSVDVHQAAQSGDIERLEELIGKDPALVDARDEEGHTPLHSAAMSGRMNIVLFLLENGASADARNTANQSPLLYAAYTGHADIVDTLIAHGAQIEYRDTRGYAPIHFAAREGRRAVVELLVSKGAAFDERGYQGKTPLHFAATRGHTGIVEFLVARGAEPATVDDDGMTPMASALAGGYGATAEALLDFGTGIEGDDDEIARYLNLAAAGGSRKIVDILIGKGARLDGMDETGRSLLHNAVIGGMAELARTMSEVARDINAVDNNGKTALHYAVGRGNGDVVGLILDRGADPNIADAGGRTPLHVAEDTGRDDIAGMLRARGALDVDRHVHRLEGGAATPSGGDGGLPIEIVYIANEGFLISRGEKQVVIDAVHQNPWGYVSTGERIFTMMLEDRPPLDGIDLCIASHAHADHMLAGMTVELLRRNDSVVFVSSPQACDSVRMVAGNDFEMFASRVVSVDPEWKEIVKLSKNGIDVEFFGVNHAGPGQNPYKTLATIIDLDGIRIVHLADEAAESNVENFEAVALERMGIDIAFADRFFLADSIGRFIMNDYIGPEYIILMHARESELDAAAAELTPLHPNLVIFREQLEKKLFEAGTD
ncbi:MAG TPA: ankyrin repeat domain-containing protein [Patescibacteria group bacterium]|nr:ankyrin repeat domain-containing protein [Patescibacteria group bacterium]